MNRSLVLAGGARIGRASGVLQVLMDEVGMQFEPVPAVRV